MIQQSPADARIAQLIGLRHCECKRHNCVVTKYSVRTTEVSRMSVFRFYPYDYDDSYRESGGWVSGWRTIEKKAHT